MADAFEIMIGLQVRARDAMDELTQAMGTLQSLKEAGGDVDKTFDDLGKSFTSNVKRVITGLKNIAGTIKKSVPEINVQDALEVNWGDAVDDAKLQGIIKPPKATPAPGFKEVPAPRTREGGLLPGSPKHEASRRLVSMTQPGDLDDILASIKKKTAFILPEEAGELGASLLRGAPEKSRSADKFLAEKAGNQLLGKKAVMPFFKKIEMADDAVEEQSLIRMGRNIADAIIMSTQEEISGRNIVMDDAFGTEMKGIGVEFTAVWRDAQFETRRWLDGLPDDLKFMKSLVTDGLKELGSATRGWLDGQQDDLKFMKSLVTDGLKELLDEIKKTWDKMPDIITAPFEIMSEIIHGIFSVTTDIARTLFSMIPDLIDITRTGVLKLTKKVADGFRYLIDITRTGALKLTKAAAVLTTVAAPAVKFMATAVGKAAPAVKFMATAVGKAAPAVKFVATAVGKTTVALFKFTKFVAGKAIPVVKTLSGLLIKGLAKGAKVVASSLASVVGGVITGGAGFVASIGKRAVGATKSFVGWLFKWHKTLLGLLPEASKLEDVAARTAGQMGETREEVVKSAIALGELANTVGGSIDTVSKLQVAFAHMGDNFATSFSEERRKQLVRLVDTLGLSAEQAASFEAQSGVLGSSLEELNEIAAVATTKFGAKGIFKEMPKIVDDVMGIFNEFGDTAVGSVKEIAKGAIKGGKAIAKGLGKTVAKGIDLAMDSIKGFQSEIRTAGDVMLGLESDFGPLTNAIVSGGFSLSRAISVIREGANEPLKFANAIHAMAGRMRAMGRHPMMVQRFIRNVAKNAPTAAKALIQNADALRAANEERERQIELDEGLGLIDTGDKLNDMTEDMRKSSATAVQVFKDMFNIGRELIRLAFADEVRGILQFFIGVEKDGKRSGGILKTINDQIVTFAKALKDGEPAAAKFKKAIKPITDVMKKLSENIVDILEDDELNFGEKFIKIISSSFDIISKDVLTPLFNKIKKNVLKPTIDFLANDFEARAPKIAEKGMKAIGDNLLIAMTEVPKADDSGPIKAIRGLFKGVGLAVGVIMRESLIGINKFFTSDDPAIKKTRESLKKLGVTLGEALVDGMVGAVAGLMSSKFEVIEEKFLMQMLDLNRIPGVSLIGDSFIKSKVAQLNKELGAIQPKTEEGLATALALRQVAREKRERAKRGTGVKEEAAARARKIADARARKIADEVKKQRRQIWLDIWRDKPKAAKPADASRRSRIQDTENKELFKRFEVATDRLFNLSEKQHREAQKARRDQIEAATREKARGVWHSTR